LIHLIGGPPRVGKTLLAERVARGIGASWISTDIIRSVIEVGQPGLTHIVWGETAGIQAHAASFFPYLDRLLWGVDSLRGPYVIEGVDFLPEQAVRLAEHYPVRSVFLGHSAMTGSILRDHFGRQPWLAGTAPEQLRLMAEHIVGHTELVKQECIRLGVAFVDIAGDFDRKLAEAETRLLTG